MMIKYDKIFFQNMLNFSPHKVFFPNIFFYPLIKDEEKDVWEDNIFHEKNYVSFNEPPRFSSTPRRLFPSSHFRDTSLISDISILRNLCSSIVGALATDSFFCFLLPSHASFKFYYHNKNALCWLFPRTLRAYVQLQNSPFLKRILHIICCKLLVVFFLTQSAQKTRVNQPFYGFV